MKSGDTKTPPLPIFYSFGRDWSTSTMSAYLLVESKLVNGLELSFASLPPQVDSPKEKQENIEVFNNSMANLVVFSFFM